MTTDHPPHTDDAVPPPSNRKFGLLFAAVFLLIGLVPWMISGRLTAWPWIASGVFLLAALAAPKMLAPLNRLWMKFGLLLHHIVSPVVLGLMFFAMIAPMGLVMRLLGKRPIPIGFDKKLESYWIRRTPPGPEPESLRNQF
jgi:predicted membrane metal-binding protein